MHSNHVILLAPSAICSSSHPALVDEVCKLLESDAFNISELEPVHKVKLAWACVHGHKYPVKLIESVFQVSSSMFLGNILKVLVQFLSPLFPMIVHVPWSDSCLVSDN